MNATVFYLVLNRARCIAMQSCFLIMHISGITDMPPTHLKSRLISAVLHFMTTKPFSFNINSTFRVAIELMANHGVGNLVVTNDASFGLLTERDLLKVLKQNVVLTHEVGSYCSPFMVIARDGNMHGNDAAKLMLTNNIKRLPLIHNGNTIGVVTAREVVEALVNSGSRAAEISV